MLRTIRNLPIAAKIFAALGLLAVTALVVAMAAFSGFSAIKAASEEVNASADRVEQAGRGTANLLSYARAVEFLPIEMPVRDREAFEKAMSDEAARFRRRLDQLEAGARSQSGRDDVAKMRQLLASHEREGARILRLSRDGAFDERASWPSRQRPLLPTSGRSCADSKSAQSLGSAMRRRRLKPLSHMATWTMVLVLIVGVLASAGLAALMCHRLHHPAPRCHHHCDAEGRRWRCERSPSPPSSAR